MPDYGIDVSNHNTVDDWQAVAGNNITFAIVKVTESVDFVDWRTAEHTTGARSAGITTGGYHFAQPVDVLAQVELFADHLAEHRLLDPGSGWPALDMEADGFADPNGFVTEFRKLFRDRTGVRGLLVYANLYWYQHILRPDEWADDDVLLWIAHYNGDPGNPGLAHPKLAIHQHSSTGEVPGIPGPVDRNTTIGAYTGADFTLAGC